MTSTVDNAIDLLGDLVGFDTTSHLTNLPLIDYVGRYLEQFDVPFELVHNEDGTKANLYATIGPAQGGGVVLSGHTDVVPVKGQSWDTDPFAMERKDGRVWGRGTTDMKGFLACALAIVPRLSRAQLDTPVHLAFSYDEEIGCLGVHGLTDAFGASIERPRLVIVGEPTDMKVVNAHKGIVAYRTRVIGKEAHSSATHKGANAIFAATRLVNFLMDLAEEMRRKGDPTGRFDPPYTTVHVGTIKGGTALNIIPKTCEFLWEFRLLPNEDAEALLARFNDFVRDEVLPDLKAVDEMCDVVTKPSGGIPALAPQDGSPAETLTLMLAQQNETAAVSFGTEAGIFQGAGVPTVVCGPGNILQAHTPNEFIEISQLEKCMAFLDRLADHVTA